MFQVTWKGRRGGGGGFGPRGGGVGGLDPGVGAGGTSSLQFFFVLMRVMLCHAANKVLLTHDIFVSKQAIICTQEVQSIVLQKM